MFTNIDIDDKDNQSGLVGTGTAGSSNVNYVGRVAIIGNIAGSKIFNFVNLEGESAQSPGQTIASGAVLHIDLFNTIRRNVSLLTRNVPLD